MRIPYPRSPALLCEDTSFHGTRTTDDTTQEHIAHNMIPRMITSNPTYHGKRELNSKRFSNTCPTTPKDQILHERIPGNVYPGSREGPEARQEPRQARQEPRGAPQRAQEWPDRPKRRPRGTRKSQRETKRGPNERPAAPQKHPRRAKGGPEDPPITQSL